MITQSYNTQGIKEQETPRGYDSKKWKVAKDFEAMFLNQIMKSMRSTIQEGGLTKESHGRKLFTEMLDTEYSKMSAGRGQGSLAEYLYSKMEGNQSVVTPRIPVNPISYPAQNAMHHSAKALKSNSSEFNLNQEVSEVSKAYGVSANLVHAVIRAESGGNPKALSPVGAKGLMQLMDPTAREMGVQNSFDPKQNLLGGVKYLSKMLKKYQGDEKLALAAYNAGPGNVDKYGGIPPFKETQNYVKKSLRISRARRPTMIQVKVRVLKIVVTQLIEKYESYLKLADSQRRCIVNGDIEELAEINVQLDEFAQEMTELETRRIYVLEEISGLLNVEITNVSQIKEHLQGEEVNQLVDEVARLKKLLVEVRQKNLVNHKLVQNSREFIRSSIGIITGFTKRSKVNQFQTYGQSGAMQNRTQQTRNLINRDI